MRLRAAQRRRQGMPRLREGHTQEREEGKQQGQVRLIIAWDLMTLLCDAIYVGDKIECGYVSPGYRTARYIHALRCATVLFYERGYIRETVCYVCR